MWLGCGWRAHAAAAASARKRLITWRFIGNLRRARCGPAHRETATAGRPTQAVSRNSLFATRGSSVGAGGSSFDSRPVERRPTLLGSVAVVDTHSDGTNHS